MTKRLKYKAVSLLGAVILGLSGLSACSTVDRVGVPDPILLSSTLAAEDRNSIKEVNHKPWEMFLELYTARDDYGVVRVRYGDVTEEIKGLLREYLLDLSEIDPGTLNRHEQLAFWVNLYNARVVKLLLDHYPVKSIEKISFHGLPFGPWKEKTVSVNGRPYSLYEIKNRILRPLWVLDPRIHYILFDGAVGGPNLRREPYTGRTIDEVMDEAAYEYINNFRGANFTEDGHLVVSRLYDWFEDDFGGSEEAVLEHIKKYAQGRLKYHLQYQDEIDIYKYDWSLNDTQGEDTAKPMKWLPHHKVTYN